MTYATTTDLKGKLRLQYAGCYTGATADADAAVDLASAQAEVDGRISMRWQLPAEGTTVPGLLKDWTLTLAAARSWLRTAGGTSPAGLTEEVKAVRALLADVAAGKFSLANVGLAPASPDGAASASGTGLDVVVNEAKFKRSQLSGW